MAPVILKIKPPRPPLIPPRSKYRIVKRLYENKNIWLCVRIDLELAPTPNENAALELHKRKVNAVVEIALVTFEKLRDSSRAAVDVFKSIPKDCKVPGQQEPLQSTEFQQIVKTVAQISEELPVLTGVADEAFTDWLDTEYVSTFNENIEKVHNSAVDVVMDNTNLAESLKTALNSIDNRAKNVVVTLTELRKLVQSEPTMELSAYNIRDALRIVKMSDSYPAGLEHEQEMHFAIGSAVSSIRAEAPAAQQFTPHANDDPNKRGWFNIGPTFTYRKIGASPQQSWLEMPVAQGPTLADISHQAQTTRTSIPRATIYHIFLGLVDALSFLQHRNIVHNAVKLENVVLAPHPAPSPNDLSSTSQLSLLAADVRASTSSSAHHAKQKQQQQQQDCYIQLLSFRSAQVVVLATHQEDASASTTDSTALLRLMLTLMPQTDQMTLPAITTATARPPRRAAAAAHSDATRRRAFFDNFCAEVQAAAAAPPLTLKQVDEKWYERVFAERQACMSMGEVLLPEGLCAAEELRVGVSDRKLVRMWRAAELEKGFEVGVGVGGREGGEESGQREGDSGDAAADAMEVSE